MRSRRTSWKKKRKKGNYVVIFYLKLQTEVLKEREERERERHQTSKGEALTVWLQDIENPVSNQPGDFLPGFQLLKSWKMLCSLVVEKMHQRSH